MNPTEIIDTLAAIREGRGVRERLKILNDKMADMPAASKEVFTEIIRLAHDDFVRFGISVTKEEWKQVEESVALTSPGVMFTKGRLERFVRNITSTGSRSAKLEAIREASENCALSAIILLKIVSKDLGLELQARSLKSSFPGVFTEFNVMLAHPYEERRMKGRSWPVAVEPKLDGIRVVAEVNPADCVTAAEAVTFYTRSGRPVTSLEQFKSNVVAAARQINIVRGSTPDTPIWLDGEVVSGTFKETISDVRKKDEQVAEGTFMVFDFMPADFMTSGLDFGLYKERRFVLERARAAIEPLGLGFIQIIRSYLASSEEEIMEFYGRWQAQGLEGAIVKILDGRYEAKRSNFWLKLKSELTLDLPIVGYFEGVGKYEGQLGGLIVLHKGNEVRVGSGFTDGQRETWWPIVQRDTQVDASERKILGQLAEVQYQEETEAGSLRHPVFLRLRGDRDGAAEQGAF